MRNSQRHFAKPISLPRATCNIRNYNAKALTIQIDKNHLLPKLHNYDIKKYIYNKGGCDKIYDFYD